jgi:hypothetical protein
MGKVAGEWSWPLTFICCRSLYLHFPIRFCGLINRNLTYYKQFHDFCFRFKVLFCSSNVIMKSFQSVRVYCFHVRAIFL